MSVRPAKLLDMAQNVPSKSQVKKAGSSIRRYLRGDVTDQAVFDAAVKTVEAWRAAHSGPLVKANNGLRSRARTVGVDARVSQRLKRSQTILDKLEREPTSRSLADAGHRRMPSRRQRHL